MWGAPNERILGRLEEIDVVFGDDGGDWTRRGAADSGRPEGRDRKRAFAVILPFA